MRTTGLPLVAGCVCGIRALLPCELLPWESPPWSVGARHRGLRVGGARYGGQGPTLIPRTVGDWRATGGTRSLRAPVCDRSVGHRSSTFTPWWSVVMIVERRLARDEGSGGGLDQVDGLVGVG